MASGTDTCPGTAPLERRRRRSPQTPAAIFSAAIAVAMLGRSLCAGAQVPTAAASDSDAARARVARLAPTGRVDLARLRSIDHEPGAWLTTGRDAGGTYFSPLSDINESTVGRLGFAWQFRTGSYLSLEATPLVVDGILYTSGNWGIVYALDAATGQLQWQFDPYPGDPAARRPAGNIVNRGVAVWQGKVYVASFDCRVLALDARTGAKLWEADSKEDPRYFCTGAPLIAGRVVIVGNGGSDIGPGGLRGYVSAYDLETGTLRWRTYTVPKIGDPHPSLALEAAAASWDPARDSRYGGGGTAWNALAYDADLKRVFVGTGNPAPYFSAREIGGRPLDRLYAASILSLDGESGRMVWHYQATPGDVWDFDAAAPLVLVDLQIAGRLRKTVLQANKNGYFYVLDRATGAPLSARPYAFVSWSSGIDEHFRPIVPVNARDGVRWHIFYPGTLGAHAWAPMSFSPRTGLVYIPMLDTPEEFIHFGSHPRAIPRPADRAKGVPATAASGDHEPEAGTTAGAESSPTPVANPATGKRVTRGMLKAWDPVKQQLAWQQQTSADQLVIQGGTLSTAGNLVLAGREDGHVVAYAADTGRILKDLDTGAATVAAPMTYEVNGTQYVAVMQGHGGNYTYTLQATAATEFLNEGRLLVLRLDGSDIPKPAVPATVTAERAPERSEIPAGAGPGGALFDTWCTRCHTPAVRAAASARIPIRGGIASRRIFGAIVLEGALVPRGMPRFDDVLSNADANALYAFLVDEAWKAYQTPPPSTAHRD